jgi:hypothetical protein
MKTYTFRCIVTTLMWDTVDRISHHVDIVDTIDAVSEEEARHAMYETYDPIVSVRIEQQ